MIDHSYMFVRVTVEPGSNRDSIHKLGSHVYAIKTRSKDAGNQSNQRVVEMVASELGISIRDVKLMTGHKGKSKTLKITTPHGDESGNERKDDEEKPYTPPPTLSI